MKVHNSFMNGMFLCNPLNNPAVSTGAGVEEFSVAIWVLRETPTPSFAQRQFPAKITDHAILCGVVHMFEKLNFDSKMHYRHHFASCPFSISSPRRRTNLTMCFCTRAFVGQTSALMQHSRRAKLQNHHIRTKLL